MNSDVSDTGLGSIEFHYFIMNNDVLWKKMLFKMYIRYKTRKVAVDHG